MKDDSQILTTADYQSLSDQKAEDWRTISNVNPTLFGVAGALFAAGIAKNLGWVTVITPVPLLLGVLHMVRAAKLQLPFITYLATYAPPEGASWERDIARVRPGVWKQMANRGMLGWVRRRCPCGWPSEDGFFAQLGRPSAWNTWLLVSCATGLAADSVVLLAHQEDACPAFIGGVLGLFLGALLIARQAASIERDREMWQQAWAKDRRDPVAGTSTG